MNKKITGQRVSDYKKYTQQRGEIRVRHNKVNFEGQDQNAVG